MGQRGRLMFARRITIGLSVIACAALGLACRGERRDEPTGRAQAPAASATPVDQARPGELAEGNDDAFGLPIPRGMEIRARFPDAVFAAGTMSFASVASYARERVDPERVETGPAKTVLWGARLKAKSEGAKVLRIEVILRGGEVSLVVRDDTKPPAKEGMTEAERWKALGLTPQGEPLDPTTLE